MNTFPVRLAVRFCAVANLVLILVGTYLVIQSAVSASSPGQWGNGGNIFLGMVLTVDLLMTVVLYRCSAEGVSPTLALERSWMWIYVNVVFFLLSGTACVLNLEVDFLFLNTLLRLVSLCAVFAFIHELGKTTTYPPSLVVRGHSSVNVMSFPIEEDDER